ncbi:MAG: hypothetical protein GSR85_01620 [Desulfurococcales archaeon]|nr:hypothetical protein [Desulfurococcales archaeon]
MRYRDIRGLRGDLVYKYTASTGHDHNIYDYVMRVMGAHIIALKEADAIPGEAYHSIARALLKLWDSDPSAILSGDYEDVFEAVEDRLHSMIGDDAGWIGLGRSRNDHVSASLRLYTAESLAEIALLLVDLREALLEKASQYSGTPIPGYTHGQPSQVITGACLFQAYEESLSDATEAIIHAAHASLKSPLGAGAGGGTLVGLDERLLASLLGFNGVYNSPYYAVASRAFLHYAAQTLVLAMVELSRIAEDLISLASEGIILLPQEHIATSSIMPHKANPVTLEILRARTGDAIAGLQAIAVIQAKLRYSYNLDLQEANKHLYTLVETLRDAINILIDIIRRIKIDEEKAFHILEKTKPWSAEAAEKLALTRRQPLRKAYREIAEKIRQGTWPTATPQQVLEERKTGCTKHKKKEDNKIREHRDKATRLKNKLKEKSENIKQKLATQQK